VRDTVQLLDMTPGEYGRERADDEKHQTDRGDWLNLRPSRAVKHVIGGEPEEEQTERYQPDADRHRCGAASELTNRRSGISHSGRHATLFDNRGVDSLRCNNLAPAVSKGMGMR